MDIRRKYEGEDIKKLLNQRAPILMVDALEGVSEGVGIGGMHIVEGNMFCNGVEFTEPGLIEHIAQSASAFVSYKAIEYEGATSAPVGYIGEVKKLKIGDELPKVGDVLETTITIQSVVMNIIMFSAETKVAGKLVASCQMKLSI